MIPGICSAGVPSPRSSPARRLRLPSARMVAVRSPTPAMPAKVSCSAPRARAYATHSRQTCSGGDPRRVHALCLGGCTGEGGGVLGRTGDLNADHVLGPLADQPRLVEHAAELIAQVGIAAAQHEGGHAGHRLPRVGGAAQRGDGASADALGDVLGGKRRHRGDHPLAQQKDRRTLADAVADRAHGLRQRRRWNRQADQVDASKLDVGGPLDGERVRQLMPRQILLVGPGLVHVLRSLRSPSPELDIDPTAGEQHRDGCAPAARTDHRRLAQRRRPPSHSHCSSITGQTRAPTELASAGEGSSVRGKVRARPSADLDLLRADLQPFGPARFHGPPPAGRPPQSRARGARIRASGGRASRSGAGFPPGRCRRAPPRSSTPPRGDQGLLVRLASPHGIGAEPVEDPALPAPLEELDLRHVVEGPAERERGADHKRVEEAAVVGDDDQRP